MSQVRVAIRCDFISGGNIGGVEQYVAGLIKGLGEISNSDIEYVLVTNPRDPDWPSPFAGPDVEIVSRPWNSTVERVRSLLGPLEKPLKPIVKPFLGGTKDATVPDAREFYQSLDVDIVHHPKQNYVETGIPSLYNPHDIQHVQYPEFFAEEDIAWRETVYRAGCERSAGVEVPSSAVRDNVLDEYDLPAEKVRVMHPGPPSEIYAALDTTEPATAYNGPDLDQQYLFYPAHVWPHKNHTTLLNAMAHLRDELDTSVTLVCVGRKKKDDGYWDRVSGLIEEYDLSETVTFLGYVPREHVKLLYKHAELTVFPSLYEGFGLPTLETWHHETPLCCSDIPPLSDITGDGAARFDPDSAADIAETLHEVLSDPDRQRELIRAGNERLEQFSWERTARLHELLYRELAGHELDTEERSLLDSAAVDKR
jgi:glycosyltransferase involved in cell wall biosynthesis